MRKVLFLLSVVLMLLYVGNMVVDSFVAREMNKLLSSPTEALVDGESVGIVENKQLRITKILRETEIEVDLSITTTGAELKTTYGNSIKGFWQGCKRCRNSQCDQSQEKYVAL